MTWSIVAHEPATGRFAVAVTTCAFAVGARVPAGGGRIGCLASQAFTNPLYMVDGLRLLQEGRTAHEIVEILTASDPGREHRQLHVCDRSGAVAAHTGRECVEWCGSAQGLNVSVAGNMLAGPQVVDETLASYLANAHLDLDERLLAALDAGHLAGAALDVGRAPDQMPSPELARLPNVIATPHVGGLTPQAIEHQSAETVRQVAEIVKGNAPVGAVNAESWTRRPGTTR